MVTAPLNLGSVDQESLNLDCRNITNVFIVLTINLWCSYSFTTSLEQYYVNTFLSNHNLDILSQTYTGFQEKQISTLIFYVLPLQDIPWDKEETQSRLGILYKYVFGEIGWWIILFQHPIYTSHWGRHILYSISFHLHNL